MTKGVLVTLEYSQRATIETFRRSLCWTAYAIIRWVAHLEPKRISFIHRAIQWTLRFPEWGQWEREER